MPKLLPEIPELDEVATALHDKMWRTKYRIVEIINIRRDNQNKPPIKPLSRGITGQMSITNLSILKALRELALHKIVESQKGDSLTFDEITTSDDPLVKDPGNSTHRVYRLLPNPNFKKRKSDIFSDTTIPELEPLE